MTVNGGAMFASLAIIAVVIIAIAVLSVQWSKANARKREEALRQQREARQRDFIYAVKGLMPDTRASLARFAFWMAGLYPDTTQGQPLTIDSRLPLPLMRKHDVDINLWHDMQYFVMGTIRCVMDGTPATFFNERPLSELRRHEIDALITGLTFNTDFLTYCVRQVATLEAYYNFYYDIYSNEVDIQPMENLLVWEDIIALKRLHKEYVQD